MTRLWLLVAATSAVLAGAYMATSMLVASVPEPDGFERALASRGFDVRRAVGSPLPAMAGDADAPSVLVLDHPPALTSPERAALLRAADRGADLVLVARAPADLEPWLDTLDVRALPGVLHAATGGDAVLALRDGTRVAAPGLLALDLPAEGWEPLVEGEAFRDSDGDGVLREGEPGGRVVAAAARAHGSGRVVVLGATAPGDLPEELARALVSPGAGVALVVASHDASFPALAEGVARVAAAPLASVWIALALAAAAVGALALMQWRAQQAPPEAARADLAIHQRALALAPPEEAP